MMFLALRRRILALWNRRSLDREIAAALRAIEGAMARFDREAFDRAERRLARAVKALPTPKKEGDS